MSFCTSQLTHSVLASLVLSSPVEFLHLIRTLWTALRERERLFRIVLSRFLGRPYNETKLLWAGLCFTICLNQVNKHKLCVLVCKHNAELEPCQWLYCERTHHVIERTVQLLFCFDIWLSWKRSLFDLGQYGHIELITELPHCVWCIPDHIGLIQMTQLSMPLSCTLEFHAVGTHLEF